MDVSILKFQHNFQWCQWPYVASTLRKCQNQNGRQGDASIGTQRLHRRHSCDVFMKIPLLSAWSETDLSDTPPSSAPPRRSVGFITWKRRWAPARQSAFCFVTEKTLCRMLLHFLQVRLFFLLAAPNVSFSWRERLLRISILMRWLEFWSWVFPPLSLTHSTLKHNPHQYYRCNLFASSHLFAISFPPKHLLYRIVLPCEGCISASLLLIFLFCLLLKTPREISAHANSFFSALPSSQTHFQASVRAYFLRLDIFICSSLPRFFYSINPGPYFGLDFSLLSQAGRQKSIFSSQSQSNSEVAHISWWLCWSLNKSSKSTCALPNPLTSPFMTASGGVYDNRPHVCVNSSQCAPQNCLRSSKWVCDYM